MSSLRLDVFYVFWKILELLPRRSKSLNFVFWIIHVVLGWKGKMYKYQQGCTCEYDFGMDL